MPSYESADGLKLAYRQLGAGPALLLLAGGPGMNGAYMLPVAERLASLHTVVLPDQRGTGLSGRPPLDRNRYSMALYVDDLERLRGLLGLDRWQIAGHSWGGQLAMGYAIQHPETVESLALISTCGPSMEFLDPALDELAARMTDDDRERSAKARDPEWMARDPDGAASEGARASMPGFFFDRAAGERFRDASQGVITTAGVFRTVMEGLREDGFDARPGLRQLSAPSLVIHGDYDHIPMDYAKETADCLPNGSLKALEHCGHFPWLEARSEFYSALETFLG